MVVVISNILIIVIRKWIFILIDIKRYLKNVIATNICVWNHILTVTNARKNKKYVIIKKILDVYECVQFICNQTKKITKTTSYLYGWNMNIYRKERYIINNLRLINVNVCWPDINISDILDWNRSHNQPTINESRRYMYGKKIITKYEWKRTTNDENNRTKHYILWIIIIIFILYMYRMQCKQCTYRVISVS